MLVRKNRRGSQSTRTFKLRPSSWEWLSVEAKASQKGRVELVNRVSA
jgi:hypothetical protein